MNGAVEHEHVFRAFGTDVRVLIGPPMEAGLPAPRALSLQLEGLMRAMHRRMTRFEPSSELSRLNADPRECVEVSPLLMAGLCAALDAAELTGGLVDPTLVGALEGSGYARSRAGESPAPLEAALAAAPARRAASPHPAEAWRGLELNPSEGALRRPPGLRLELGGSAKGLAADLAAAELGRYASFAVDVGGDVRFGGASTAPREVRVSLPLPAERGAAGAAGAAPCFRLRSGAVATSGIATRVWPCGDSYAHHLIDPACGEPAWTGLAQATALAPTAVEAEARAKAAFLAGPGAAARTALQPHGGLLVADDGSAQLIEPRLGTASTPAVAA